MAIEVPPKKIFLEEGEKKLVLLSFRVEQIGGA